MCRLTINDLEKQNRKNSLWVFTPEAETFQWVSLEPVLCWFQGIIKYLLIVPGLQVALLSFIAAALCSPHNPTQHFSSPSLTLHVYFFSCISLVFARVVKATGSDKKRITGVCCYL